MSESKLHRFLKYLGVLYLHDRGCRTVGTEVGPIFRRGNTLDRPKLDRHYNIDVLGVGPIPIMDTTSTWKWGGKTYKSQRKIGEKMVVRGIEVKVSRSDFRNGFVCRGINYAYLLTPMGLVKKKEVPKYVGLLEYDPALGIIDHGIRIVKRSRFQDIPKEYMERFVSSIEWSRHSMYMQFIRGFVKEMRPELEGEKA